MGIKNKNKKIESIIEHYSTELYINRVHICDNCPLKLYAKKDDKIILGTGNITTDTIIVLPSYDIKAGIEYPTMLKIVQDTYKNIKGIELLEECYVTRSIKCLNKTDFNLGREAIKSCINNLFYETSRIKPKKVIIFDKNLYDFGMYNCNKGRFIVKTVISPGVMYYDNPNLKNVFVRQFKEAIYDT